MKNVFKIFLLFLTVFVMAGCNKTVESSNVINLQYKQVSSKEDVIYNLEKAINNINGISFIGKITVGGKEYEITGKAILNSTIADSFININYGNNSLYIKDGNVYISYYYRNTNVIVKDSIDNFIEEIIGSLENKGIKCNKEKIYDVIKNKTLKDVDTKGLIKYLNMDNGYSFIYKKYNIKLGNEFLPEMFSYENSKFKVRVDFDYEDISIRMPIGYNILTVSISDIKELLGLNYISDLIK